MPRFYLAPFVGTGAWDDAFRPPVVSPFSQIDLRGDPTQQAGFCILRLPAPAAVTGGLDLGDDLDGSLPVGVVNLFENRLGLTLDMRSTLRQVIPELLLLHGTVPTDRTRWNNLQATRGRNRIVIGGEVVFDAPVVRGTTLTEDFNKADNGLGPDQTWSDIEGTFGVVSNQADATSGSGSHSARVDSDLAGDDNYAEAEDWNSGTGSNTPGVACRFSSSANTHYLYKHRHDGTDSQLKEVVAGSQSDISVTADGETGGSGLIMRVEAEGSTIRGFYNGTMYHEETNTSITSGVRVGLSGSHNGSDRNLWDNFEGGDLASGPVFPEEPTNLAAVTADANQIDLTWDAVTNATGYDVERDTDNPPFMGNEETAVADHGTNSYSDTGLSPSTTYYYRVNARREA